MDNPETLTILDTQDTERRQTKHKNTTQKTKKMSTKSYTDQIHASWRVGDRRNCGAMILILA
jgi:hypothetical protein